MHHKDELKWYHKTRVKVSIQIYICNLDVMNYSAGKDDGRSKLCQYVDMKFYF